MKTVPRNVQIVTQDQAVDVSGLPEEVALALADIASVAWEGLLAMSVAAGMAVMQAMFEAEITAVAGPKGKHDPGREVVRHGTAKGSVTLGGRRVGVSRPRARTLDGHEVLLRAYAQFAADDLVRQVVLERMLAGARHVVMLGSLSLWARTSSVAPARRAGRRCRADSLRRPRPHWPNCWPGTCPRRRSRS